MNHHGIADEFMVLALSLHGERIGHLAGYKNGRNVLVFDEGFQGNFQRPTLSLITHPNFPRAAQFLSRPAATSLRLHPLLSNLLPEGVLRAFLANALKIHTDHEFALLACLGSDLPGALVAAPLHPDEVPQSVLHTHGNATAIPFDGHKRTQGFSLAGVQMKFSAREIDGRYNLAGEGELGDWIIKTPSTRHKDVPLNEFTAMTLAGMAGIEIPPIKLVELAKLDGLPAINLPDETLAYAIKRFDRDAGTRVHMEDFAQILLKYPHEKYGYANYEQIGSVIYQYSGDGLLDVQQFARRLLVNVLLANGDAHLKNWSLWYPDKVTPRLSPAYDILTTRAYIPGEQQCALNLAKTKMWYQISLSHFEYWAKKAGIPWRAVRPHLDETMEMARSKWPTALQDLPMAHEHQQGLREHWSNLMPEFRILT